MIESAKPRDRVAPRLSSPAILGACLVATSGGAGEYHHKLMALLQGAHLHASEPVSTIHDAIADRFVRHVAIWRRDTMFLSSSHAITMHPDYQAIIGMGPNALPLILRELEERGGHWFWALKAISGEDPVVPRDRGVIERMRSAWLAWGRGKGLIA